MLAPDRSRSLLVAVLALGVPVALTACSSSSTSTPTTAAASGGSSAKAFSCSMVPASDVNTALGTSVGAPQSNTAGTATSCTYSSTNPIQTVIIRVDTSCVA